MLLDLIFEMHNSKQSDFINQSQIRLEAGETILEDMGDSSLVNGPLGEFWKTPQDDEGFLVRGALKSGQAAGVRDDGKLQVEGLEGTGEHYMLAHNVLHLAGKEVPFDDDCRVCNPGH